MHAHDGKTLNCLSYRTLPGPWPSATSEHRAYQVWKRIHLAPGWRALSLQKWCSDKLICRCAGSLGGSGLLQGDGGEVECGQ
jgi:hypothetical protein